MEKSGSLLIHSLSPGEGDLFILQHRHSYNLLVVSIQLGTYNAAWLRSWMLWGRLLKGPQLILVAHSLLTSSSREVRRHEGQKKSVDESTNVSNAHLAYWLWDKMRYFVMDPAKPAGLAGSIAKYRILSLFVPPRFLYEIIAYIRQGTSRSFYWSETGPGLISISAERRSNSRMSPSLWPRRSTERQDGCGFD